MTFLEILVADLFHVVWIGLGLTAVLGIVIHFTEWHAANPVIRRVTYGLLVLLFFLIAVLSVSRVLWQKGLGSN